MTGLERLGAEIARQEDALRASRHDRDYVREHLSLLEVKTSKRAARPVRMALFGLPLAAAAALLLWLHPFGAEPLTLRVGESAAFVAAGSFVEAPKTADLAMRFSDGTRIEMAPQARGRVVTIDPRGAHLALESGQAHVRVVHRPHASWRVSAGPFAVRVTGTRFDVRWSPEQDEFELELKEGHVVVSGCVLGQGYPMRAGQTVRASCRRGRFDVVSTSASEPAMAVPAQTALSRPAPSVAAQPSAAAPSEPMPAHGRASGNRASMSDQASVFRALAEQGKFAEAFTAANTAGFSAMVAHANADELMLLADCARYAHDPQREAKALRALRYRFSGTKRAGLAAFALGRLESDSHGSYGKAAGWFRTYLKEQPAGPLTREARGRLMEATLRAGDMASARELAGQYLQRYPAGPHAGLARSLQTAQ